jgi:hypothetical protein
LALVESQLFTLEDISVNASRLSWAGCDNSVKTTSLKLLLQSTLNLALSSEALGLLLLYGLALLLLLDGLTGLLLAFATEVGTVVSLIPLTEWSGIDLDDGGLGEGVGADQLVVGRMEGDGNDTDLAGNTLRSPGEVAGVEAEGTEFAVSTTGADEMDSLCANTGVGWLTAGFESALLSCKIIREIFSGWNVLKTWECLQIRASTTHGNGNALLRKQSACVWSHERYPYLRICVGIQGLAWCS